MSGAELRSMKSYGGCGGRPSRSVDILAQGAQVGTELMSPFRSATRATEVENVTVQDLPGGE